MKTVVSWALPGDTDNHVKIFLRPKVVTRCQFRVQSSAFSCL